MNTIAIVIICQVALLAIVWGLLSDKMGNIHLDVNKQLDAIQSGIDRVGDRVVDNSWNEPVTVESLREVIRSNGYTPDEPFEGADPTLVTFKVKDLIVRINAGHLPYLAFQLGFTLDMKDMDIELLHKASREVSDAMYLAKVSVTEDPGCIDFGSEVYCDSLAYLRDNFGRFLNIPFEAHERHRIAYARLREESKKAVEDMIASAFHKDHPDSGNDSI